MSDHIEIAGIDWSAGRILPAFQTPQHLDVYDIRGASSDAQLSIATMAGLINRPRPQVYLIISDDDAFWLKEVFASIPQDTSPFINDQVLETLLITYRSSTQGVIIYDPNCIDSINVATTLAGLRGGVVFSPEQALELQGPHKLPLLADLRTYQWRSRLAAYQWAYQNLLSSASAHLVAGLDPRGQHGLRAFLVATGAFVYWLDSRNTKPDPTLGSISERGMMQDIFSAFPAGIAHLGWFIDEGSSVDLTSETAKVVLASDLYYNLEAWTSVQPGTPIAVQAAEQQVKSTIAPKVYVSFTMSEGDNLQYNQHRLLHIWQDTARGSIPIGWTTSLVLLQAAPAMAAYYAHTATPGDELLAGPSGAGYIYPSRWPAGQLSAFLQLTGQLMQSMHLSVLEVLDTANGQSGSGMALTDPALQQHFVQALLPFGLRGILSGAGQSGPSHTVFSGVPVYQNLGLIDSTNKAVALIRNAASSNRQRPLFLNSYVLAWKMGPSDLKQVMQQLGSEYEVVTPGTLLTMLTQSH